MCELGTDGSRAGEGLPEDQRALRRYRLQSLDYVSSVRHPVCCPCPIVQHGRTTGARLSGQCCLWTPPVRRSRGAGRCGMCDVVCVAGSGRDLSLIFGDRCARGATGRDHYLFFLDRALYSRIGIFAPLAPAVPIDRVSEPSVTARLTVRTTPLA